MFTAQSGTHPNGAAPTAAEIPDAALEVAPTAIPVTTAAVAHSMTLMYV